MNSELKTLIESELAAQARVRGDLFDMEMALDRMANVLRRTLIELLPQPAEDPVVSKPDADERDSIRRMVLEEAAQIAWRHYMDTCKKYRRPAAEHGEWIASSAIREAAANQGPACDAESYGGPSC